MIETKGTLSALLLMLAAAPAIGAEWQCGRYFVSLGGGLSVTGSICRGTRDNNKDCDDLIVATIDGQGTPGAYFKNGKFYYRWKACTKLEDRE